MPTTPRAALPRRAPRIRALERHLAALVASSDDAIIGKTLDGTIVSWNDGAERLYGYRAAEAIGQSIAILIPADHSDELPAILARLARGERIAHFETVRRHQDGALIDVSVTISPIRDDRGAIVGASSIARDITDRRRLERQVEEVQSALRESEERLQLAAHVAGFGTYDDRGAGQVYWSPELIALFGLPAGVRPGDGASTALASIHPDDRERWLRALDAARAPDGPGEMDIEHRLVRPDGSIIWVAQKGRILFEGEGAARRGVRAVGVVADITARKEAEAALRASREQLAATLTSIADGITVQEPDGQMLFANEAAARLIGFPSVAELVAAPREAVLAAFRVMDENGNPLPPDELPGRRAAVARAPAEAVVRYDILATGEQRWSSVRAVPVIDDQSALRFTVTSFQDITALKQAEAALRESETRYRVMANTAPSVVWTAAPDGTITFANDRWFEYCGITPEENATHWPELVLHPDDRERCLLQWNRALADGSDYEIEVRNRRHDGEYRWFLTRAIPFRDPAGRIVAWFGNSTDINDRKQAEAALQEAGELRDRALAQAEAALRVRDEFLAAVSHDLRTPLSTIKGLAQLLARQLGRMDLPQRERFLELLATVDRSAGKMGAMVDELLDLTRLEAGQPLELRREAVDLVALVRQGVAEQARSAPLHTIRVETAGRSMIVGMWDPGRLERVLANLLSNAVKYSPDGGEIVVRARLIEQESGGAWAELAVEDPGMGIPAADLPFVFERFRRGANVARQVGGAGIGLAGTKRIVELHGGTIAVASEEGFGTSVTVRLPVADVEDAE